MKRTALKLTTAISFILSIIATAEAAESGWYIGGAGAFTGAETDFDYATGNDTAEYDLGWGISGYTGYKFANGLRAEAELGVRQNDISNIDITIATNDSGKTRADTALLNVIYDFHNSSRFTPYVGAGVGGSHISHDLVQLVAGDTVHDDDYVLAGQGIAGVSYKISEKWDTFIDYRHLVTADQSTRNSGGVAIDSNYTSQAINIGARYNF